MARWKPQVVRGEARESGRHQGIESPVCHAKELRLHSLVPDWGKGVEMGVRQSHICVLERQFGQICEGWILVSDSNNSALRVWYV